MTADDQAAGTDLAEAERYARSLSKHSPAIASVMAEYDRRAERLALVVDVQRTNQRVEESLRDQVRQLDAISADRDHLIEKVSALSVEKQALADAYICTRDAMMQERSRAREAIGNRDSNVNRLLGQIAAVQALHQSDEDGNCVECDGYDGKNGGRKVEWPCPTVAALGGTTDTPRPACPEHWVRGAGGERVAMPEFGCVACAEGSVSPREDETPEPAPPGVHDAMRAYGIDPATYAPEIVTSSNTTPLAGSVSNTPDPAARPIDCGELTQVWAPCAGCRQAAAGQPCACAGGWCCERHRAVDAIDDALHATGNALLDEDTSEVLADAAVKCLLARPDLIAALAGTAPTPPPVAHQARRGDAVEAWIKAARDRQNGDGTPWDRGRWNVLDDLLDDYRLHSDTGTPLDRHACDGGYCCGGEPPADYVPPPKGTWLREDESDGGGS